VSEQEPTIGEEQLSEQEVEDLDVSEEQMDDVTGGAKRGRERKDPGYE
jgi:hypothetical protein